MSILRVGSKIMEKVVRDQLSQHMRNRGILPLEQHGFMQLRSTNTAVHYAVQERREAKAKGEVVGTILFDLLSAFDLVDAVLPENKMKIYGADKRTCLWIRSYMTERWQEVQVGDAETKLTVIPCGVPQRGGLSPLLFVIFTADMPERCLIAQLILYADDTTGFVTGKTMEDVCQKLEAAAHKVLMYMKINRLSLNEGKTQFLVFGKEGSRDIKVGEATVSESKTVVLLGATINKTLDWYNHVAVLEREKRA
jgi:hypothetical protein